MTRSPTEDPARVSKRKGTRSVSTLTPTQLARKRANDREAQRAIRARTKEHIEKLERELEQMKRLTSTKTVEQLIRRNAELERQVAELSGPPNIRPPFPPGAGMCLGSAPESPIRGLSLADSRFNVDGIQHAGSGGSSRTSSFGQGSPEYNPAAGPGFGGATYLPTPEPCETWPVVVPVSAVSVPSVVSSPCSSTGHPDDYVPGYIPTSVPASMMSGGVVPGATSVPCMEDNKAEFDELDTSTTDHGYGQPNVAHTPTSYMPQQQWPVYATTGYYAQSPTI